jgi:hypothetical protein
MRLADTVPPRCAGETQAYRSHQLLYGRYRSSVSGEHLTSWPLIVGDLRPSIGSLPDSAALADGHQRLFCSAPQPHGRQLSTDRRVAWSNYFLQDGWVGPSFAHLAAVGLKVLS